MESRDDLIGQVPAEESRIEYAARRQRNEGLDRFFLLMVYVGHVGKLVAICGRLELGFVFGM